MDRIDREILRILQACNYLVEALSAHTFADLCNISPRIPESEDYFHAGVKPARLAAKGTRLAQPERRQRRHKDGIDSVFLK